MPVVKHLKILITVEDAQFQQRLDHTSRGLKNLGIAATAASAVVVGALSAIAVQGLRAGKELDILAKRANATPEAFQRMAVGARKAGIENDKLSDILQDVNDRVGDFMSTGAGPMADFFENIAPKVGVTVDQFRRLSGPEALQLYVDSLEKAGVNQKQMTFYMEAMASDATMLIPLLRNGGLEMQRLGDAAEQAGQIISSEMIEGIVAADNAVQSMSDSFQAFQLRLASEMAPALEFVATRLNELAQSGAVKEAIDRIVESFGSLADIILSENFIGAAVSGLELLMRTADMVANGMIWMTQNVEIATAAFSAAAIAAAALGGPLTIVIGLLGGALVGIAALRSRAQQAAGGVDAATEATRNLNAALGTFSETASPAAAAQARDLAKANLDIKRTALEAARAEILKNQAIADSEFRVGNVGGGPDAVDVRLEQSRERAAALEAEIDALDALETKLSETARRGQTRPRMRPMDGNSDDTSGDTEGLLTNPVPGLGGGGAVDGQMSGRLEALMRGLATEEEVLAEWREEGMETLREALESEMITEEEYRRLREKLEAEHTERMGQIRGQERNAALQGLKGMFGDLSGLMRSENDKLFKIGQAAAIARATVNGIQAAVASYKHGAEIGGPPLGAAFAAASIAKTSAMISQIAAQSPSGGGGASAAGAGAPQTAGTIPGGGDVAARRPISLTLVGDQGFSRAQIVQIAEALNDSSEDGQIIDIQGRR